MNRYPLSRVFSAVHRKGEASVQSLPTAIFKNVFLAIDCADWLFIATPSSCRDGGVSISFPCTRLITKPCMDITGIMIT